MDEDEPQSSKRVEESKAGSKRDNVPAQILER
jgi:hypothetical protein